MEEIRMIDSAIALLVVAAALFWAAYNDEDKE